MPLYVWHCPRDHTFEALAGRGVPSLPCPHCSLPADRSSVYAPNLATREPFYHGKNFLEASQAMEDRISRMEEREGKQIARPNFFKEAMEAASKAQAAGWRDSNHLSGRAP